MPVLNSVSQLQPFSLPSQIQNVASVADGSRATLRLAQVSDERFPRLRFLVRMCTTAKIAVSHATNQPPELQPGPSLFLQSPQSDMLTAEVLQSCSASRKHKKRKAASG